MSPSCQGPCQEPGSVPQEAHRGGSSEPPNARSERVSALKNDAGLLRRMKHGQQEYKYGAVRIKNQLV
ncbi:hypothetical protein VTH06DRAFT_4299 [Thermothelomyces fergusii]